MQVPFRFANGLARGIRINFKIRLQTTKGLSTVKTKNGVEVISSNYEFAPWERIGYATDLETEAVVKSGVRVYENFVSEEEEKLLMAEIEPQFRRLRYENSHWDDAIHGYREIERKLWSSKNQPIIDRLQRTSFDKNDKLLPHVHVLDLLPTGVIKAHVDSVKFCGSTISGLCLLTSCVMRFASVKDKQRYADVLLPRFCLYIMKDVARYDFTHEVLASDLSIFKGQNVVRSRRVVVLCRNRPKDDFLGEDSDHHVGYSSKND